MDDEYDTISAIADLEMQETLGALDTEDDTDTLGALGIGMEPPTVLHSATAGRYGQQDLEFWVNRWRQMYRGARRRLRQAKKRIEQLERQLGIKPSAGGG